jgi:hypothetical protein
VRRNACEICGGLIGAGTDFSPSTSVLPSQYHSTGALYTSSRLGSLLNVFWSRTREGGGVLRKYG